MFINDVGENTWEEINDGIAGANYGWPDSEGPTSNPAHRGPIQYYGHGSDTTLGCAITGGLFYNPPISAFPAEYSGDYFFADYCSGWINQLDPANGNTVSNFATGITFPVDLKIDDAARKAEIHDDIVAMPLGYHTPISASTPALSGGQRQRLVLARALVTYKLSHRA